MPNSALRIFLSSTAIDMQEHRQKVTDALLRLDSLPVKMEAFGAMPNSPVDVCKSKVRESDALVVMIAHRYGWVPTKEEGGDGKKSITWIEVETALENQKPIFVFIVDDKYAWSQPSEQDQLGSAKDEKEALAVFGKVQALKEFKDFLSSKVGLVKDKFTTPDVLALNAITSLSNWIRDQAPSSSISSKRPPFVFRTVHHLQPAPHFKGRKKLLDELIRWWQEPVTPDRVRSLVAIGGTGKTAVIEKFLKNIEKEKLRGSVLVWSFYDEPNTDAFLNEACIVFIGEEPEGIAGKSEKLQRALASENNQNLIVLDGLERVQSDGKSGSDHAKGDLEDHRLKNLLRAVSAGLGNTRVLITSRFKLTDLMQWEGAGYKSHDLDVLDIETAVEVLRAWEIKGDDKKLKQIVESVGKHALSISVLGSYLNHYCNCDPDDLKEFDLNEISTDEPLAARLARILGGYARSLAKQEYDLLVRLSVFPKGVSVDILGYLINAGGEVAGALIGINQKKLLTIAEKLKLQGLIYSYKNENTIVYTAHPFLRDYFRGLLGINPEDIHEVVRNKLAIGLDTKPENKPNDTTTLDRYEKLIEYTILAGHHKEASELYVNVMGGGGGSNHLYHKLSDYGRIIRICSLFSKDGTPENFTDNVPQSYKGTILNTWGLATMILGDLKTASSCFNLGNEVRRMEKEQNNLAQSLQNTASMSLCKGLFPTAKRFLEESLSCLPNEDSEKVKYIKTGSYAYLAYTFHNLGEVELAKMNFLLATEAEGEPLYSDVGFCEAEHLMIIGEKEKAINSITGNLSFFQNYPLIRDGYLCHALLGALALPEFISQARQHLEKLREWPEKSGDMECVIHSHILASEIAYFSCDYPAAIAEAVTGFNHAESCGYGKFTVDFLLLLSKIQIAIPDYKNALSFARQALDRSSNPECGYAWGEANALHLCGICHKALGEFELARQRLEAALKLREKIQHPEAEETRKLLAELPPK